jgi:hypothetical protein
MRVPVIILLFVGTLLSSASFALSKDELYEINIAKRDSSVRANVFSEKKVIKTRSSLTYYWYAYNHIYYTQGGYDGRLLNGSYACFYPNGNLKQKGTFRSGLKTGEWVQWHANGVIAEISHWDNGTMEGAFNTFDTTGTKTRDCSYRKGKLNGTVFTYINSKLLSMKKYNMGIEILPKIKKVKSTEVNSPSKENSPTSPQKKKNNLLDRFKKPRSGPKKEEDHKPKTVKKK